MPVPTPDRATALAKMQSLETSARATTFAETGQPPERAEALATADARAAPPPPPAPEDGPGWFDAATESPGPVDAEPVPDGAVEQTVEEPEPAEIPEPPAPALTPVEAALLRQGQVLEQLVQQRQPQAPQLSPVEMQRQQDEQVAAVMQQMGLDPTNAHHVFMVQTRLQQEARAQASEQQNQALAQELAALRQERTAERAAVATKANPVYAGLPAEAQAVVEQRVAALVQRGATPEQAIQAVTQDPLLQMLAKQAPKRPAAPLRPGAHLPPDARRAVAAVAAQGRTAQRLPAAAAKPQTREDRINHFQFMERNGRRPS